MDVYEAVYGTCGASSISRGRLRDDGTVESVLDEGGEAREEEEDDEEKETKVDAGDDAATTADSTASAAIDDCILDVS